MKILIDNGHGIFTPGKRSPDGQFREAIYTRQIARRIVSDLQDRGQDAQNRYELIDMKSAANNYTSGNPYWIDREIYDKLIQGLKKLANSSNGLK